MNKIKLHALLLVSMFILMVSVGGMAVFGENIDPNDDGSQYAYGENVGWLNLEPGGDGGPGVEVGDCQLTGYAWGENIGWISLSCENTNSCGIIDYGIGNDGKGNLSGYAWGENVGWINFAPTGGGVFIDAYGDFSGMAWGENIGWISFAPTEGGVKTSWGTEICEGDFGPDGDVDGSDLAVFALDYGRTDCGTGPVCEGDFDGDGDVDGSDLAIFAADYGRTDCPICP
jgi:hypothetical protein